MRPIRLLALVILVATVPALALGQNHKASTTAPTAVKVAPDAIAGRVIDATTKKPVKGEVVVALEDQTGNGKIINETSPDAQGHFSFAHVPTGTYALVIAGQTEKKQSYAPVILVSSSQEFGQGKIITPGTNVGTIALKPAAGSGQVKVPINSDKPITVTLAAHMNVASHSFQFPWPDGIPTFDTRANADCSGGGACTTATLSVPTAAPLVGVFNGNATQLKPDHSGSELYLLAKAYTQNGAKPTCTTQTLGPVKQDVSAAAQASPFDFVGCE